MARGILFRQLERYLAVGDLHISQRHRFACGEEPLQILKVRSPKEPSGDPSAASVRR
jgi:hypothetical protein